MIGLKLCGKTYTLTWFALLSFYSGSWKQQKNYLVVCFFPRHITLSLHCGSLPQSSHFLTGLTINDIMLEQELLSIASDLYEAFYFLWAMWIQYLTSGIQQWWVCHSHVMHVCFLLSPLWVPFFRSSPCFFLVPFFPILPFTTIFSIIIKESWFLIFNCYPACDFELRLIIIWSLLDKKLSWTKLLFSKIAQHSWWKTFCYVFKIVSRC